MFLKSWWWTGRPGMLRFMGSQRVGHNWATGLNWTQPLLAFHLRECNGVTWRGMVPCFNKVFQQEAALSQTQQLETKTCLFRTFELETKIAAPSLPFRTVSLHVITFNSQLPVKKFNTHTSGGFGFLLSCFSVSWSLLDFFSWRNELYYLKYENFQDKDFYICY